MVKDPLHNLPEKELHQLISTVYKKYGYDFSEYSEASLKRRIVRLMNLHEMSHLCELEDKIVNSPAFLNTFVEEITVNVTEMFRDASFYRSLTENVLPAFSHLPMIRIWHAGCSTGEEVYSMAILLKEAELLQKTILYATDINQSVLEVAVNGKYPLSLLKEFTENYLHVGGKYELSTYYSIANNELVFEEALRKKMVFSHHNLCIDQSFNEFDLIVCRNVLIYFNRNLQDKVFKLFVDSISANGFLALGSKETIEFSSAAAKFESVDKKNKIWKTKRS